jgi:hypothetical protein
MWKSKLLCIACLLIFSLALAGCSIDKDNEKDYYQVQFKGKTANWEAEHIVTRVKNDHNQREFILRYLGNEKLESLQYEYDSGAGRGSVVVHNLDKNVFISKGGDNGDIPPKEGIVKVKVIWNGKTEQFNLSAD